MDGTEVWNWHFARWRRDGLIVAYCRKKITDRVYMQESSGFWVMATVTPSAHCGGVAIFYHEAEHFSIKEIHLHVTNVIIL